MMLQTQVIQRIEKYGLHQFKKEEIIINCMLASQIRRCCRDIFHSLYGSETDLNKAGYIRMELLKFQSSPYLIPRSLIDYLGFRDQQSFSKVWGGDLSNIVMILKEALSVMNEQGSALVQALVKTVTEELDTIGINRLKIWCHRSEVESYIELFKSHEVLIDEHNFICSLPDYRSSTPFETLLTIGPLRHQGWSKKPRVIISAPRYKKLIQIVWSGSQDEVGFYDDPLIPEREYSSFFKLTKTQIYSNNDVHFSSPEFSGDEIDDYNFFKEKPLPNKFSTNAVLLEFNGNKGVLLPINSQQLIFDHNSLNPEFAYKTISDIELGNFLLMHDISPQSETGDFERVSAPLAEIWKSELEEMYRRRYQQLMYLMQKSAIDLMDLDRAVKKWIQRDGTVVYGPQHKRHFRSLIEDVIPNCLSKHGWQDAWREIQNSRVKAIQNGKIEHAIINELLIKELNSCSHLISELCAGGNYFSHKLPDDGELNGQVRFYPVNQKSYGFRVGTEILGVINSVEEFEQFRVEL